tara:strand:- start:2526 stop:2981 length:456 start_codon:yes stop_codon:yes gene_type:complete
MSNIYAGRNIKVKNDDWQSGFDFEPCPNQEPAPFDYDPVDSPLRTLASDLEAVQTKIDYESLRRVLEAAYDQASIGKGKERHAGDGLAFTDQPIQAVSKLLNTSDGLAFQAIKKVTESQGMKTFEQKERELLGAIVYIAGMIIFEQNRPTI